MKRLFRKYRHAWILSYYFIYFSWYFFINQRSAESYHQVYCWLDAKIPFNEWFIIPYYLWFLYVPIGLAYFFFYSRQEFYDNCKFVFTGLTICLLTYTIYPNGITFRPDLNALGRDNVLIEMTRMIYQADRGTNVCPSIHCFNSIALCINLYRSKGLKKKKWICHLVLVLTVLICMSTVYIKQHSIIDIGYAVLLSILMYLMVYGKSDYEKYKNRGKE